MPIRAVLMARDAGPAAAIAPVARALIERGEPPTIIGYDRAATAFAAKVLPQVGFPEDPTPDQVARMLEREHATVLLTGTSLQVEDDRVFWAGGEAAGVRSIALLDHWVNYAERFTVDTPFDS